MKRIARLLLVVAIPLSVASICSAEIVDTGIVIDSRATLKPLYWWDDDNLLVSGVRADRKTGDPKGWRLLRYKPSNGSVIDMGSFGGALCVANGFIRFWRPTPETEERMLTDQKRIRLTGSLENLVEEHRPLPPPSPRPPSYNELSNCKFPDELPAPEWLDAAQKSGRIFRPLKPEHGWMEFIGEGGGAHALPKYPITILRPEERGNPVPVDIKAFQPWIDRGETIRLVRYEAFKKAYLMAIADGGAGQTNGGYWWLYPDGRVEQILLYTREKTTVQGGSYLHGIPAKDAFLRISVDNYPVDKSGLYLRRADGSFKKLISGWAGDVSFSVSPDGCQVAIGIDTRWSRDKGPHQYRLHLINVCERNSK